MRHTRGPTEGLAQNNSWSGDAQPVGFYFWDCHGNSESQSVLRQYRVACRQEIGRVLDWAIAVTKPVEAQATS